MENKLKIQDNQYKRPYHHLLNLEKLSFHDYLGWGLEYYSYVSFILDYFKELRRKMNIKRVADVGCGDGKITLELARQHPSITFEGYDLSKQAILFAKAYSHNMENLEFYNEDFKHSKGFYDIILCIEVLEHIPDNEIEHFVKILYSKLKEDGLLIVSVPTQNLKVHPKHYRHYTLDLLKEHLKLFTFEKHYYLHNFKSIKTRVINFILINGLFILNNYKIRKILIDYYSKHLKIAGKNNSAHILATFKKKSFS